MTTGRHMRRSGDYLSFKLGDELYAIEVLRTKEVVGKMKTASFPGAPDYVDGVVNLRDQIFPVVNLRARLGLPRTEDTDRTCIIIVEVTSPAMKKCWEVKNCTKKECPGYECSDRRCWMLTGTHCRDEIQGSFAEKKEACSKCELFESATSDRTVFDVGVVIDEVCDVRRILEDDIDECPAIATGSGDHFVLGLARYDDKIIKLLDVTYTLGGSTFEALQECLTVPC